MTAAVAVDMKEPVVDSEIAELLVAVGSVEHVVDAGCRGNA